MFGSNYGGSSDRSYSAGYSTGNNWGVGMGYSGGAGSENRGYDSTGYSSYGDRDRNTSYGFSGDNRGSYGTGGQSVYRTETTTYTRDSDRDRSAGYGYGSSDRYGSSGNLGTGTWGSHDRSNYGSSGYGSGSGVTGYNTSTYTGSTGIGGYDRYDRSDRYGSSGNYGSSNYGSSGNYGSSNYTSDRRDYNTGSNMRYGSESVRDSDRYTSGYTGGHGTSNYGSYYGNTSGNYGSGSRNDYGYQSSALSRYDDRSSSNRYNDRSSSAYGGNYGSSYTTDRTVDRSYDRSRDNDNDQGFFASIGNWMSNLIGLTDKSSTGGSSRTIRPQIVEESGQKKVQYNFDVRGFSPENVNLTASGQRIEVTATQEDKDDDHHVRREYRRVITVPEGIKVESFKSRVLQNGVLRVEAPIQVDQLTADQQRSLLGEIPITKGSLTAGSSSTGTSSYSTGSSGTTGKTTTTTEHVRETKTSS